MNIEEEVFKRTTIDPSKLLAYGFTKENEQYVIKKYILKDTFQIVVTIDQKVVAKIYDVSFAEEYTNYRIENQKGEFVSQIRKELLEFLNDIKKHCTIPTYFQTEQANQIAQFLKEEYGTEPEFAWESEPGYGIFRNFSNQKWYALIMNINKNKLDRENKEVEIINIKLEEAEIENLLKRKGFYKAYHMNKKNWITILLDGSVPIEEIFQYIKKSYALTEKRKEWIIPANPKYYDMFTCFTNTDTILWKQPPSIQIKDKVYIYVGAPYSALLYQCEVVEINIPYSYKDAHLSMNKVMKLKLLSRFAKEEFPYSKLKEYGISSIRGPRYMPQKVSNLIHKKENV